MGDVFLLGAGFSKAVSDDMPLLQELSSQIRGRLSDLPESLSTLGDNIEIWLSYLSQPHPWLRESENLRNRALALEITEEIEKVLDEKEHLLTFTKLGLHLYIYDLDSYSFDSCPIGRASPCRS